MRASPNERTLAAYEAAAQRYTQSLDPVPATGFSAAVEAFAAVLPPGAEVLELGSGPGRDADLLEARGLVVHRTDGAAAFVRQMRTAGKRAEVLNIVTDDFGGPYDAVFASAVLLHLSRAEFGRALAKAAAATTGRGVLGFSVKEGDGAGWSSARLGVPRHFTYWRRGGLQAALDRSPWQAVSMTGHTGRVEDWIQVLARRRAA